MVIFGAGASFDSSDTFRPPRPGAADREERPPLADDLFQQRGFFDIAVREYRECATVATRLRRHFHSTLEGEMERLRLEAQQEEQTAVELHAVRYAAGDVSKFPTHLADEGTSPAAYRTAWSSTAVCSSCWASRRSRSISPS